MSQDLLTVRNLSVHLRCGGGMILQDISLSLRPRQVLGVVGGSGSGKTTLGLALLRLLPPAMEQTSGSILYRAEDLAACSEVRLRALRGGALSMVYQEPASAFDPLYTVGRQIAEALEAHGDSAGQKRIVELLVMAGVKDPQRVADSYPHELSGGLLQRAMIAQAVSCSPGILIADEPTSSLDVRVQARVMELFMRLKDQLGLGIILITHDLGLIRHFADDVLVLDHGVMVDHCPVGSLLFSERADYTRRLLEAESL